MFEMDSWHYRFCSQVIFLGIGQKRKLLRVLENRCYLCGNFKIQPGQTKIIFCMTMNTVTNYSEAVKYENRDKLVHILSLFGSFHIEMNFMSVI